MRQWVLALVAAPIIAVSAQSAKTSLVRTGDVERAVTSVNAPVPLHDLRPAHADFSGTWSLDVAKSEANQLPTSETLKVTQTDESMTAEHTITVVGRTGTLAEHFMLDGSPSTNTRSAGDTKIDFKTTAAWRENVLVMTTTWVYQGTSYSETKRYSLSDNGRTLTTASEVTLIDGRTLSDKLVFVKQ